MKPSLGRIVHFVDHEMTHHAAIVIKVWDERCVNLRAFLSSGEEAVFTSVTLNEDKTIPYSWHWPEKE